MENKEDADAYMVIQNIKPIRRFNELFESTLFNLSKNFDSLSLDMKHEFKRVQQKELEFSRKMNFCTLLKGVIQKNNPTWKFNIVPTGSSVSGLATENSDLDVAIHIPQAAQIVQDKISGRKMSTEEKVVLWRNMQMEILQIVRLILQNDEDIKHRIDWKQGIQLVPAQIQILKVVSTDHVECDISVVMDLFLSSMHNSFMIRQFTMCDHRFAPLCFVVKQWADSTGVKNPKDGGFNSYALVLLVIHFLQCGTSQPLLPNIIKLFSKDNFIAQSELNYPSRLDFGADFPRPLPKVFPSLSTVAGLFLEFVHYYYNFNFANDYISIKDAMVKDRHCIINIRAVKEKDKQVYIEDPFDSHNPGRTVRSISKIKEILKFTIAKFDPSFGSNTQNGTELENVTFPTLNDILYMKVWSKRDEEEDDEKQNEGSLEARESEQLDQPVELYDNESISDD